MSTLYLVDGSGYIFRAYYAVAPLTTSSGLPTNAILGFSRMLIKLLRELDAEHIAVMFDTGKPTFRHKKYSEYKANRGECPEDLVPQMPYFRKVVEALGIQSLEKEGFEADDIIGTVAKKLEDEVERIVIVSGDKDLTQLVNDKVEVWDAMRDIRYNSEKVKEKFGVPPEQIIDYLALVGDSSDNIPGLKGVGPKSALKLIEEFGSVDSLLENSSKVAEIKGLRGAKKISETIESDPEQVRLSKELVSLDNKVSPFDSSDMKSFHWKEPNTEMAKELFNELEFSSLLESLKLNGSSKPKGKSIDDKSFELVGPKDFDKFIKKLSKQEEFAFDTETTSLDVLTCDLVGMSFSWEEDSAYYLPFIAPDTDCLDLEEVRNQLGPIMANPEVHKSGLNLKFDVEVLEAKGWEVEGIYFDAMLASYVLRPDSRQHSLSAQAKNRLGIEMLPYKDLIGEHEHIGQVPVAEVCKYACHDAEVAWLLKDNLDPQLSDSEHETEPSQRRVFEEIEMPLIPVLSSMERAGILVDATALEDMSAEFAEELGILESDIHKFAGREFNINSPKQLSEILFEVLEIPTKGVKKTKSGFSTDAKVLSQLQDDYEIAERLVSYRELHKLKSTYVDALSRLIHPETGRIHTSYNQSVAATGRLSSSDPNLQNIPIRNAKGRRIREAFISKPGYQLVSADYSQIELRVLAHLSDDKNLQKAFKEGLDIHEATARDIFGDVLYDGGDKSELRRYAKTINFGIIYGMSAFRLANELSIGRKQADQYIEDYFARYKGVKQYFDALESQLEDDGYVETMFGRRRFLEDVQNIGRDKGYVIRSLLNAPIQGSAAEIIKCAMINLDERLKEYGSQAQMLLQVHDELVVEVHEEILDKVKQAIVEEMEEAVELDVPLKVDIKHGVSWGNMT